VPERRRYRISAQSPPRFDTTISRPALPWSRDAVPVPRALLSGLQRIGAGRIICGPFLRPAGTLPQKHRPPAAELPKSVAGSVKLITSFGLTVQFRPKGNDCLWPPTVIAHRVPLHLPETLRPILNTHSVMTEEKTSPRSARRDHRGSPKSANEQSFFRSSDTPLPRVNCGRPNTAQRGLGRENAVAQDWRSRPRVDAQIAGYQGVACLPIPAQLSRTVT
jgi:hypothetical protein